MSLLLKTVYEEVTRNSAAAASQQKVIWVHDQPTQDDLDHIMREGSSGSEFDSNNLRNEVLRDLQAKRAKLITKTCRLGKVLAVVYPDQ
jgi:hypothetical protein